MTEFEYTKSKVPARTSAGRSHASAAMLVIQSSNRSFDGFELMNGGQLGSDPAVTQSLCDKLQAIRARNPETDP